MKPWKISGAALLAFSLGLGIMSPALAAPEWAQQTQDEAANYAVYKGEVLSIDEAAETFVIQSADGELTISVSADTEYFAMPGLGKAFSFARCLNGGVMVGNGVQIKNKVQIQTNNEGFSGFMARFQAGSIIRERLQVCLGEGSSSEGAGSPLGNIGEAAAFSDITVGSLVAVWPDSADDELLATRVYIVTPADCEGFAWQASNDNCPFEECPVENCPGQGFHGQGKP